MSWDPEIEELKRRVALAHGLGGTEKVARQKAAGRLTVRERIDGLVDGGSFHETGAISGAATYDEKTANWSIFVRPIACSAKPAWTTGRWSSSAMMSRSAGAPMTPASAASNWPPNNWPSNTACPWCA